MELTEKIKSDISDNSIILFMKGTKDMPMCGFSNQVVQILNHYGVDFKDVNILEDPMIRIKLSEHSGWPTIPQLFVKGKLVGGADIAMELHERGELLDILDTSENEYGLPPRTFGSFIEASDEAAISRIYGGIHYMPAITYGVEQGEKVGKFVLDNIDISNTTLSIK